MLMTDIHVRSFSGASIKPYIHSIAKLHMEVFRDYPYFETPDLERETNFLKKISTCKESISVLIFDNTTLVGVSLGYPLSLEEPALLRPFKDKDLDVESYFFFSDSALLKQYRGRGIGHHFFDARETHVQNYKKYQYICFCVPEGLENDPQKPEDYTPLHDFWRKRGYVHSDLKCSLIWNQMGQEQPQEREMCFWIKDLDSATKSLQTS